MSIMRMLLLRGAVLLKTSLSLSYHQNNTLSEKILYPWESIPSTEITIHLTTLVLRALDNNR
jgi:hypothetical protein